MRKNFAKPVVATGGKLNTPPLPDSVEIVVHAAGLSSGEDCSE